MVNAIQARAKIARLVQRIAGVQVDRVVKMESALIILSVETANVMPMLVKTVQLVLQTAVSAAGTENANRIMEKTVQPVHRTVDVMAEKPVTTVPVAHPKRAVNRVGNAAAAVMVVVEH